MIAGDLIAAIRRQYRLDWRGVHGITHWARVLENGLKLAELTGARPQIVELFAVFHDASRENEDWDPGHGARGAALASTLRGVAFDLPDHEFQLLCEACVHHTEGKSHRDITVLTCWDADRLDLGRVRIRPHPRFLCTEPARDIDLIEWACERSLRRAVPDFVTREWDAFSPEPESPG